eukprot:1309836-Prymnesium_polylepis.1
MAAVGPAAAPAPAVLAACLLTGGRTSVAQSGMSVTAAGGDEQNWHLRRIFGIFAGIFGFETATNAMFAITFRCVLQILYPSYLVRHSSVRYGLRLPPHEI